MMDDIIIYPTAPIRHYAFAPIGHRNLSITLDTFSSPPGHTPLMDFKGWRLALNRGKVDLELEISDRTGIVADISLKRDEAVLMSPRTISSWRWTSLAESHVIEFPPSYLSELSLAVFGSVLEVNGSIFLLKAPKVLESVDMLSQTLDRARKGSARIAGGFADVAAIRLLRSLDKNIVRSWGFSKDLNSTNGGACVSFETMVEHLRIFPSEKINIKRMMALSGLSRATLNRMFNRYYDVSPMTFLRRLRVERATELLQAKNLSLSQIAIECGFCDQAHMSKVLKASVGCSPSNFR